MANAITSTKPRYTKAQLKAKIGTRGRKPVEFYQMFPNERPEVKKQLAAAAKAKATAKAQKTTGRAKTTA